MDEPIIDQKLIRWLKKVFPNQLPNRSEVDDTQYLIGRQAVVSHIEALYEAQKENDPLAG